MRVVAAREEDPLVVGAAMAVESPHGAIAKHRYGVRKRFRAGPRKIVLAGAVVVAPFGQHSVAILDAKPVDESRPAEESALSVVVVADEPEPALVPSSPASAAELSGAYFSEAMELAKCESKRKSAFADFLKVSISCTEKSGKDGI